MKDMPQKKWNILSEKEFTGDTLDELISILLENRGIVTPEEKKNYLHASLKDITTDFVGIDHQELYKTLVRLKESFIKKEKIIIYGDYDVDGITGTAILWETMHKVGFNVMPYIPHRVDEGYGLSLKGIDVVLKQFPETKIIITVDNGIVAHDAVTYANSLGLEVIVTDHHLPEGELKRPSAFSIVHTTKLCGAGVAWLLSKKIFQENYIDSGEKYEDIWLELATMGTIADLVPLVGANRTLVKFGLKSLQKTHRPGLLALFQEAALTPSNIGTYEVGYVIGPRLNAAGRIESAMDSLRLLCTTSREKAEELAYKLGRINRERQDLTKQMVKHAFEQRKMQLDNSQEAHTKKILFIAHETYNPGVIGLVAGKLVEEFYLPAIVLSIGEQYAKASVRSIAGVNIIELLRSLPDMYVNIGGHPMAAGFTVANEKMKELKEKLEELAEITISEDLLLRNLNIDAILPLSTVTHSLFERIQELAPFGMGNPEPSFMSTNVTIEDFKLLGKERNHLKLRLSEKGIGNFEAIGFGMGELAQDLTIGDTINIAYTIDENKWNGNISLQLKLKDLQKINN